MLNIGTRVEWTDETGKRSGVVIEGSLSVINGPDAIRVDPTPRGNTLMLLVAQNKLAVKYDPHCTCGACAAQHLA